MLIKTHLKLCKANINSVQLLYTKDNLTVSNKVPFLTGTHDIFKATKEGHLKNVIYLIETGSSPSQRDSKNEENIIHVAAERGHHDIVKYLIGKGADVNATTNYDMRAVFGMPKPRSRKRTALHLASFMGHFEIVQYLIEKGANVNVRDEMAETALHLALMMGHSKTGQCLIENGANVNEKTEENYTALHFAAEQGYLQVVQCLIKKGADVNARNVNKETALHLASTKGHLAVVQCLREISKNSF